MLCRDHWVAVSLSVHCEKIRVTIYDSMKRLNKPIKKTVYGTVLKLPINSEYTFRTGDCSKKITIRDCGINTITNLVSMA